MAKLTTLGIIRSTVGDYLIVPCGCEKELTPPRYKGIRYNSIVNGAYPKPVTVEFHTDYVFEEVTQELEVAD